VHAGGSRRHGHIDVVPAQDPAQFRPRRRAGGSAAAGPPRLKGGLVSMLYGAAAANELGLLADGLGSHLAADLVHAPAPAARPADKRPPPKRLGTPKRAPRR
jgi:hypothetical protein